MLHRLCCVALTQAVQSSLLLRMYQASRSSSAGCSMQLTNHHWRCIARIGKTGRYLLRVCGKRRQAPETCLQRLQNQQRVPGRLKWAEVLHKTRNIAMNAVPVDQSHTSLLGSLMGVIHSHTSQTDPSLSKLFTSSQVSQIPQRLPSRVERSLPSATQCQHLRSKTMAQCTIIQRRLPMLSRETHIVLWS